MRDYSPDILYIPLDEHTHTVISPEDADLLLLDWHPINSRGLIYAETRVKHRRPNGETYLRLHFLHRVILGRIVGRQLLQDEECDHIDCAPLNNLRNNLRLATHLQNTWNRRLSSRNKSGFKGVWFSETEGRFIAHIRVNGKQVYLGRFDNAEDAHEAYCNAATEHFGVFARFK